MENFDVSSLQEEALRNIEADSFWCMSKLLDGIQVSLCAHERVEETVGSLIKRPTRGSASSVQVYIYSNPHAFIH